MKRYGYLFFILVLIAGGYGLVSYLFPKETGRFPFFVLVFLADIYLFRSIRNDLKKSRAPVRRWITGLYWSPLILIGIMTVFPVLFPELPIPDIPRIYIPGFIFAAYAFKLVAVLFLWMGDGIFLVRRLIPGGRAFSATWAVYSGSRRKMIRNSGMAAAAVLFSGLTWGMISGAYRFRLSRIDLRYGHLPGSFEGFKIVQISDLHLGSWAFPGKLEEVVRLIMKEMPDLIVFTGDLVNDRTREAEGFGTILSGLRAPFGVYAILGNHDYGDYARWASSEEKAKNMQELQDFYNQVGWKLLRNEYTILEKDGGQMALIGSENWGALSRFPKYGDLSLATERMEQVPFSILLTHDPTHWDLHVIRHTRVIDLTLSGHTHGFQFGIEYEGLSWSPARLLYKHWGGLYHENHTASNRSIDLYVNRGLGHLGYPGRVGILPEITVFQLFT